MLISKNRGMVFFGLANTSLSTMNIAVHDRDNEIRKEKAPFSLSFSVPEIPKVNQIKLFGIQKSEL